MSLTTISPLQRLKWLLKSPVIIKSIITAVPSRGHFWEPYRRGTHKFEDKMRDVEEMRFEDQIRMGFQAFKEECKLWKIEMEEALFRENRISIQGVEPYEIQKLWEFKKPGVLESWVVSCDSDWDEGFSSASLTRSPGGYGLFSGYLDSHTLPKDRTIGRVGWVNITSPKARRSFFRESAYEWSDYTHMVMRVRGDGRTYGIMIRTPGSWDLSWFDLYSFGLYTHGGPYWQFVRIPFSRFVFAPKGTVQDYQEWMPLDNINSFGISLIDRNTGPFRLEIDYIGLEADPTWNQKNAYESYYVPQAKSILD